MTLLTVVQDVCAAVGVTYPQSVFASITSNRTMQEMVSLANETAQHIAYDYRDWTMLQTSMFFDGDGATTVFPLPSNFKRFLLNSNARRLSTPTVPLVFIPNFDDWIGRGITGPINQHGEWIKVQNTIGIRPALADGDRVNIPYMIKDCVTIATGGRGDKFINDGDTFSLSERVLKLGMIYLWKQQKGSSYAEDMSAYGDALALEMGHDVPAPIMIDHKPISAYARTTMPTQTIYVPEPPVVP